MEGGAFEGRDPKANQRCVSGRPSVRPRRASPQTDGGTNSRRRRAELASGIRESKPS